MLKPRSHDGSDCAGDGLLLIEVTVTMAVKANGLEQADELVEALMQALRAGDPAELKRLGDLVSPGSWRSWGAYDEQEESNGRR